MSTQIQAPALQPEIVRLAELNECWVRIRTAPAPDTLMGHQYLLFFPFGRIQAADPAALIGHPLTVALVLNGFRPWEAGSAAPDSVPQLVLSISDWQLSAYDFLFFRRIVAEIGLEAQVLYPNSNQLRLRRVRGRSSALVKMAFAAQLSRVLDRAIAEAISALNVSLLVGKCAK